MGLFNILLAVVVCPDCKEKSIGRLQFKFGNTFQLLYNIGDTITWGGNDYGNADLNEVKAYGILESTTCPICNKDNIPEDYDIFFKQSVIIDASPIASIEEYVTNNTEYVILK